MFSGFLYCADCGGKLYYSATNNYKREQAYFFCSAYRKDSERCSAHFIREKVVSELVLKSMRETFCFVQIFERRFAAFKSCTRTTPQGRSRTSAMKRCLPPTKRSRRS